MEADWATNPPRHELPGGLQFPKGPSSGGHSISLQKKISALQSSGCRPGEGGAYIDQRGSTMSR